MTEYIEREAALSELKKIPAYFDSRDIWYGISLAMDVIRKLPVADTDG